MRGIEKWHPRSSVKVVLVECPSLLLTWSGIPLNPPLLRYPKYPQLLLTSNIRQARCEATFVDLKGQAGTANEVETIPYQSIEYEGGELTFSQVGLPAYLLDAAATDADVIGFSCNFSMERTIAIRLIERVRMQRPDVLILVGGHDATVSPLPYLRAGADLCVLGEGETFLDEMLNARTGDDLRNMRGVAYQVGDLGVRRNGKRPIHRLDEIHYPSSSLLSEHLYDEYPDGPWPIGVGPSFAVLETSRGCNEQCAFCSSSFVSGKFREWSVEGVLGQLEETKRAGITTLLIADDNILYRTLDGHGGPTGRSALIDLFETMRREGFSWTFYNGIQFGLLERDGRLDQELISALFTHTSTNKSFAGCFEAYLPLERFGTEDMARLPKLREHAVQNRIIKAIADRQVPRCNLGFILGTPEDSWDSVRMMRVKSLQIAETIRESAHGNTEVSFLPWCSVPLSGTPNRSRYKARMAYDLDRWPELHSNYISVMRGVDMTPGDFTLARRQLESDMATETAPLRAKHAQLEPHPASQWALV